MEIRKHRVPTGKAAATPKEFVQMLALAFSSAAFMVEIQWANILSLTVKIRVFMTDLKDSEDVVIFHLSDFIDYV
ncbi:hypothetical protein [Mesorhizobium amorphae]|uniref:hypothetical protein n=1 Tax=Mesorhizobium amorphae TaxID=71433 RepID=UPI0011867321|nr:hypothetical protein [Mesorhizobium amorphae]